MAIFNTFERRAVLATCAAFMFAASASSASAETVLRVGKAVPTSFAFALLNVGIDAGIFENHGLTIEVTEFGGAGALQQGMAAGALDIGLSTGADVSMISRGAEVTPIYTILNRIDMVLLTQTDSPYQNITEMQGRRVSVGSLTSLTGWIATNLSDELGWGVDGFTLVPGRMGAAMAMFQTGEIDAMTADLMIAADFQHRGIGRILYRYTEHLPDFPIYVAFATNDMVANRPDDVHAFVDAWVETITFAQTHREETIASVSTTLNIDPAVVAVVLDENIGDFTTDGLSTAAAVEALVRSQSDLGAFDAGFDMAAAFSTEFLPGK